MSTARRIAVVAGLVAGGLAASAALTPALAHEPCSEMPRPSRVVHSVADLAGLQDGPTHEVEETLCDAGL
jgi:hypothetical protein